MALQKARLVNVSVSPPVWVDVLFNPTEYGIDRGAAYADLQVPGLETPILQFVRGEAETLTVELFLDRSAEGKSVEDDLAKLRKFVQIDPTLHAPPVCSFQWGANVQLHDPPGPGFQGVVTALKEKYSLFDDQGHVLRARVTLTLKSYKPAEVQLREISRQSPDRTHVRVLREGERLDQLANETYGNPRLWRVIARANRIDRPRFVRPGTPLFVPALDTANQAQSGAN
jgi:hypothetical protein